MNIARAFWNFMRAAWWLAYFAIKEKLLGIRP